MEDSNIIALFFERSEHAIKETEIKYGKLIRSIAFRILKHPADTEECENDTYMGMWTSIPPVCPGNLKAYAAKTARNQALKKYRFQHAEKRNPEVTVSLSELGEQLSDGMNSLEKSLFEDRELADIINSFLADLKPGTRQVFMLRYWYFLSIKEIMSECGMSKSKVESILFRTRCRLKEYLERVWRVK